ncbi:MAG: hypothetical protein AB7S38_21360 [Vulcanimicrobiota bacterium]
MALTSEQALTEFVAVAGPRLAGFEVLSGDSLRGFRGEREGVYLWVMVRHFRRGRRFAIKVGASYFGQLEVAWLDSALTRYRAYRLAYTSKSQAKRGLRRDVLWNSMKMDLSRLARGLSEEVGEVVAAVEQGSDPTGFPALEAALRAYLAQPERPRAAHQEMTGYLAGLRLEGSRDSEGEFSLEAGRAREKLQAFALEKQEDILVHLLAATVALGASKVSVRLDADDLEVEFNGAELSASDLQSLFTHLLIGEGFDWRRHLALALSAAAGLETRLIHLESANRRLVVEVDGEELVDSPARQGNRVHIRRAPGLAVLKRFFSALFSPRLEIEHVRRRCPHFPLPLSINERDESRPLAPVRYSTSIELFHEQAKLWLGSTGKYHRRQASQGCYSALVGLGSLVQPGLWVQRHGVWLTRPNLDWELVTEMVVEAPSLTTDLSYSGVTDSPQWRELVEELRQVEQQVLEETAATYLERPQNEQKELGPLLLKLARTRLPSALKLPLVPVVGGMVTLDFLDQQYQDRGRLLKTAREWTHPPLDGQTVVSMLGHHGRILQERYALWDFGDTLLHQAEVYHQRLAEWLALPVRELALQGSFAHTFEASQPRLKLGLTARLDEPQLQWWSQGRPVLYQRSVALPAGCQAVLENDELRTNYDWTSLHEDESYRACLAALEKALDQLYRGLGDEPLERAHRLSYLLFCLKRRAVPGWLRQVGVVEVDQELLSYQALRQKPGLLQRAETNRLDRGLVASLEQYL